MFERLNFQGKVWRVLNKVDVNKVENPNTLKQSYRCDMVIKNHNHYFILDEIIDVEYENVEELKHNDDYWKLFQDIIE